MRFPLHIATDMMRWQRDELVARQRALSRSCSCSSRSTPATSPASAARRSATAATCATACRSSSASRRSTSAARRWCRSAAASRRSTRSSPSWSTASSRASGTSTSAPTASCSTASTRRRGRTSGSRSTSTSTACAQTHDHVTDRPGMFDQAIAMIKEGKRLGYQRVHEHHRLPRDRRSTRSRRCARSSPTSASTACCSRPATTTRRIQGEDHFLLPRRDRTQKFTRVLELAKRYPVSSTPLFLEFAAGQRDYPCTPWGNPTRTPKGWKGPCYLIEGQYYPTWKDFWGGVDWDYWEIAPGPALPELHDALGLRAVGGAQARREPARRAPGPWRAGTWAADPPAAEHYSTTLALRLRSPAHDETPPGLPQRGRAAPARRSPAAAPGDGRSPATRAWHPRRHLPRSRAGGIS